MSIWEAIMGNGVKCEDGKSHHPETAPIFEFVPKKGNAPPKMQKVGRRCLRCGNVVSGRAAERP